MERLTVGIILLASATLGTGAINTLGVLYYQDFPLPWFCDLGLILIWLRLRRELAFEFEQGRQQEAETETT